MWTPRRPVKRQLVFTPASTGKRFRTGAFKAGSQTGRYRALNRRTSTGPRTVGTLASQVKALQKFCRNLAPEKKYADIGLSVTDVAAAGTVVHCSAIGTGDIQATRNTNTINVTNIDVSGYFTRLSTDFVATAFLRVALVVDKKQVSDTSPTAAQIFATGDPATALPNVDTLERFSVLWLSPVFDAWRMVIDSDRLVAGSVPTQSAAWSHAWKGNLKVSYNGNASTDIEKNGIYFVYLTSSGVTTFDSVATVRIGYTDV